MNVKYIPFVKQFYSPECEIFFSTCFPHKKKERKYPPSGYILGIGVKICQNSSGSLDSGEF